MTTPIIILFLLITPWAIGMRYSKFQARSFDRQKYACLGLAMCFFMFSIGHFIMTTGMVEMLPPWLPMRTELVYLTGVLECLIAIGLLFPNYRVIAVKGAIVSLIIFFPANVYAACNSVGLGGHQWGPIYLLIRTPLQLMLLAWSYAMCLRPNAETRWFRKYQG